jgi:hypothetical protein
MPYRNWADSDTLNAADLNAMTADASTADVTTNQSTTSGTFTDLTTVGPAVTLTLVSGQGALVIVSARANNSLGGTSGQAIFSFAVSGASTLAATDANGVESHAITTPGSQQVATTRVTWFVASATGSHTFTMKYRAGTAGTSNFIDRRTRRTISPFSSRRVEIEGDEEEEDTWPPEGGLWVNGKKVE